MYVKDKWLYLIMLLLAVGVGVLLVWGPSDFRDGAVKAIAPSRTEFVPYNEVNWYAHLDMPLMDFHDTQGPFTQSQCEAVLAKVLDYMSKNTPSLIEAMREGKFTARCTQNKV